MPLIEFKDRFGAKGISDAGKDARFWRSGTYEFIYETGPKAGKLLNVLSDQSRGYSLVNEGVVPFESDGSRYLLHKFSVMKKADGQEARVVGELEAQFDAGNSLIAVFLGASNKESPAIAKLVLGKE